MLSAYGFLKLFDGFVDEFYLPPAFFADEVIVMMHVTGLVADEAFLEVHGRSYAGFAEELQRTIDRDLADSAVASANKEEKLFHRDMVFGVQECVEYLHSLRRYAKTFYFQIFRKLVLYFRDVFLHDASLVGIVPYNSHI